MKVEPVTLTGKRAKLVPMEFEHVEGLFAAGQDQEIFTYSLDPVAKLQDMEHLVSNALSAQEDGTELPFVIVDLETDKIVGTTRFLDISAANRSLEIGWTWLSSEVWGTRINTECKYLLLKHCFEDLQTVRVQFKADARNIRSLKALERIGAKREGVLRKHRILPDGFIRDSVYFSVIAEEWPEVKMRLENMLNY